MNQKIKCGLTLLGVWLLVSVWSAAGQAPTAPSPTHYSNYDLSGRVEYTDHSGIADVQVALGGIRLQAITDSVGNFELPIPMDVFYKLLDQPDSLRLTFIYLSYWQQQVRLPGVLLLPGERLSVYVLVTPTTTQVKMNSTIHRPGGNSLTIKNKETTTATRGLALAALVPWPPSYSTPTPPKAPEIPYFPIRPPRPTTPEQLLLPSFLAGSMRLDDANARLRRALDAAGYAGHLRYYAYPQGFALVTLLERIDEQAKPYPMPDRFNVSEPPKTNWGDWFRTLLGQVPVGHFRVMVFLITSNDVLAAQGGKLYMITVNDWVNNGPGILPKAIGEQVCSTPPQCTVWVYEFKKQPGYYKASPAASGYSSLENLARSGVRLQP